MDDATDDAERRYTAHQGVEPDLADADAYDCHGGAIAGFLSCLVILGLVGLGLKAGAWLVRAAG